MQRYAPLRQEEKISNDFDKQRTRSWSETKEQTSSGYEETTRSPAHRQGCLRRSFNMVWMVLTCLVAGTFLVRLVINALPPSSKRELMRNAIVVASYSGQNTSWLQDLSPDWHIHKYTLDDPSPTLNITVPRNQGREAMAYLTYIITNYANLSPYTIFIHGHSRSWHQPEPIAWKLRALNLDPLATEGYINLRCSLKPGCSADTILGAAHPEPRDHPKIRSMMATFWTWNFQPEHGRWDLGPYPSELGQPCCAQFAVSRERILARPKEFYEAYRRPMERDVKEMKKVFGPLWTGYRMGILYEHLWHVVFGKEALFCPDVRFCREVYFRDQVRCGNYTGDFEHSAGWRNIECQNRWDHGDTEMDVGEIDTYGGWDGIKNPESNIEIVEEAEVVVVTENDVLGAMESQATKFSKEIAEVAEQDRAAKSKEMEAAAAVVQNFATQLHTLVDETS